MSSTFIRSAAVLAAMVVACGPIEVSAPTETATQALCCEVEESVQREACCQCSQRVYGHCPGRGDGGPGDGGADGGTDGGDAGTDGGTDGGPDAGCSYNGCGDAGMCCALDGGAPQCRSACGCTQGPDPIPLPCQGDSFSPSGVVTIPEVGGWGLQVALSCSAFSGADFQRCMARLEGNLSGRINTPIPMISEIAISGQVYGACTMPAVCRAPPKMQCDPSQACCELGATGMGRVECGKRFDWQFAGGLVRVAAQLTAGADATVGVRKQFGPGGGCINQTCWSGRLGVDGTAAASASLCPPMFGCVLTAGAGVKARGEGTVDTCLGASACGCITVVVGELRFGPWSFSGLRWQKCAPDGCAVSNPDPPIPGPGGSCGPAKAGPFTVEKASGAMSVASPQPVTQPSTTCPELTGGIACEHTDTVRRCQFLGRVYAYRGFVRGGPSSPHRPCKGTHEQRSIFKQCSNCECEYTMEIKCLPVEDDAALPQCTIGDEKIPWNHTDESNVWQPDRQSSESKCEKQPPGYTCTTSTRVR